MQTAIRAGNRCPNAIVIQPVGGNHAEGRDRQDRGGGPAAIYHDRSGIFVHLDHERETITQQLAGEREARQVASAPPM